MATPSCRISSCRVTRRSMSLPWAPLVALPARCSSRRPGLRRRARRPGPEVGGGAAERARRPSARRRSGAHHLAAGGTASEQPQQQALIEALQRDAEAQLGADLITGDLEALKTAIHTALKKLEEPKGRRRGAAARAERPRARLPDLRRQDRKATIPLRKFLRQQGLDVRLPAFEGDAAARPRAAPADADQCDAVMVFYGAGDEAWKRAWTTN